MNNPNDIVLKNYKNYKLVTNQDDEWYSTFYMLYDKSTYEEALTLLDIEIRYIFKNKKNFKILFKYWLK